MMIGIGHLRPSASIVSVGVGAAAGPDPGAAAGVSAGRCAGVTRVTSRSGLRAAAGWHGGWTHGQCLAVAIVSQLSGDGNRFGRGYPARPGACTILFPRQAVGRAMTGQLSRVSPAGKATP